MAASTAAAASHALLAIEMIHTHGDRVLDKVSQPDVCFTAIRRSARNFVASLHNPVTAGEMACSDCHNPHESVGPKLMVKNSVQRACYTCTRPPRAVPLGHSPVTEDCTNCHTRMVRTMVRSQGARSWLCQECHTSITPVP